MVRDIKFRAWDIEENKMIIGNEKGLMLFLLMDECCVIRPLIKQKDDDWFLKGDFGGKYILMQYTGLKDKNGREIYEGDIGYYPYDSEYDGNIPKGKNLWEVRWEGDMYMLYRGEGDHARYTGDGNCGDDPHYNKWEEFEIKGNIHQNPELLK